MHSRFDEPKSANAPRSVAAMSAVVSGVAPSGAVPGVFTRVFAFGEGGPAILMVCLVLASGVHGALGAALVRKHTTDQEVATEIIDIDMTPAPAKTEEPPPPPPPVEPPEPQTTSTAALSPKAPDNAKPTVESPPPQLGSLGKILGTPLDPNDKSAKDDPEVFETDENGQGYSGGTSGVGGGPNPGKPGGAASGVPGGTGTGTAGKGPLTAAPPPKVAPTEDLSRNPTLGNPNACKGFFPSDADDDSGQVQVLVTVAPTGQVTTANVLLENPKGQGFGKAARTCLLSTKLSPGLDAEGKPTTKSLPISIKFIRY